ncbi:MAG: hypothetical protein LQ340_006845 [Diploschistes diacapsis]|nr:MAG: hypothetical protein LQ340_006845 [Diploschistes diacapsis]
MPPRLGGITQVHALHHIRHDNHHPEIRPRHPVLQVLDLLPQPMLLVRLGLHLRAGRRIAPCAPHARRAVAEMRRQLRGPGPGLLLLRRGAVHDAHAGPDRGLGAAHPAALVSCPLSDLSVLLRAGLNVRRDDPRGSAHAPLHADLLGPEHGLDRPAAAGALRLARVAPAGPRGEQLGHLLHARVRGEGGQVALERALVPPRRVVLVLRQAGPQAAADAEAGPRQVGGWRVRGRGAVGAGRGRVQRAEHEFGGVHLRDVREEGAAPGGGGRGEVAGGCCGHCAGLGLAEQGGEAGEGRYGGGCWKGAIREVWPSGRVVVDGPNA